MQSFVDWLTNPGGELTHLVFRSAPKIPMFAASQVPFPKDRMWLKMRLKPTLTWLMLLELKMCVSDTAALRPWLEIFCVLAKAPASENPGEPPGTNESAWS